MLNSNNKLPNKYLSQYLTNVLGEQTHFFSKFIFWDIISLHTQKRRLVHCLFFSLQNDFSIFYYRDRFSCLCIFLFIRWENFIEFFSLLSLSSVQKENKNDIFNGDTRVFCTLCPDIINWLCYCNTYIIIVK